MTFGASDFFYDIWNGWNGSVFSHAAQKGSK